MRFSGYDLAQFNMAPMLAPLDDTVMEGFVDRLEEINTLADRSPGFVWRLQDESGDATAFRPGGEANMLINMSVWESIEELFQYTYQSSHAEPFRMRREWFLPSSAPQLVLWWVPVGEAPTPEEGLVKLNHLRQHGVGPSAFTFREWYDPEGELGAGITALRP